MPAAGRPRAVSALALVGLVLGAMLALSAGSSRATDPEAPHHAPAHWLPNEEWVWQHWLPYDEGRLYALLHITRGDLWRQMRDDSRTVIQLAERRGWKGGAGRLASALVAPRRAQVSPARFKQLRSRARRTLTQGHLAQHIFFHSLHQGVIPDRASQIFGVESTNVLQRLRRAELSPLQIGRLHGRSSEDTKKAAIAALRERAHTGVRTGQITATQAGILLDRQLRQLPRWLGQTRYNGPPPLYRNPRAVLDAKDYANNPTISADGGRVAYEAVEASIPAAKKGGEINVRVRDRSTDHSQLASVAQRTRKAPRSAYNASLSGDGRYVAYETSAGNLNFAKRYGGTSVGLRDLSSNRVVSIDPRSKADARRSPRSSYDPAISADGRYVAFESARQDTSGFARVFELGVYVHDLRTRRTVQLAPDSTSGIRAGEASDPDLSGDGRRIAFSASVPSPVGRLSQVFVHDFGTGRTVLASSPNGARGEKGNGESYDPAISDDGRHVAFTSTATNLIDDFGRPRSRVYVRDLSRETTELASVGGVKGGPQADGFAFEPAISGDGRRIAFASVVPGGGGATGREAQVYLRDFGAATTELVSRKSGEDGSAATGFSTDPAISRDGRYVSFTSDAANLSNRKYDSAKGIFVRDVAEARTALVSKGFGLDTSPARRLAAAGALALGLGVLAFAVWRALSRRRRPGPTQRPATETRM
jgi:Tol biopolymer transport system component